MSTTTMLDQPWTEKYRPRSVSEVAGNRAAVEKVGEWYASWNNGEKPKKNALLLYGPPGIGKTSLVHALATERGLDLVEVNASDKRSGEVLSRIVGLATGQTTLFAGRQKIILLDEIDGINLREDTGAIQTIIRLIKETNYPIFLTANDPWDPKTRQLREACVTVEMKRLGIRDGLPYLKSLVLKENLKIDDEALRLVLERDKGDIRSILNDLEMLGQGQDHITVRQVDTLSSRDRNESVFEALRIIFNSRTVAWARRALSVSDVDPDMLFQWILENAPYQISEPNELLEAMIVLADADLYFNWARSKQSWHLSSYGFDLMTGGVGISKVTPARGWVPMRFPQKISSMSRSRGFREARKRVNKIIGIRTHSSTRKAQEYYSPMLRFIHEQNEDKYREIVDWLGVPENSDSMDNGSVD